MKLSTFLLIVGTLQTMATGAYSQQARLTLDMEGVSIIQILDEIEDQSEFYFLVNHKLVDTDRKVNLEAKDKKIDEVLDEIFENTDIDYLVMDRQIVLSPKEYLAETKETIDVGTAVQQQLTVTGTVVDGEGLPLPGVNVVIVGTVTGAITDVNGYYEIVVPSEDAVLRFSYIGHLTMDIPVAGQTTLDVVLLDATEDLDEVVVIGYGVQRKSNITGAIASVDADELQNRSTSNVGQALQGKISGVQILNMSGAPGSNPAFRVRGYSSNSANSDPLYIVDGLKVKDIGYLDPSSIESIEVLKDAASAAIYGAEAGNGVVLISTRQGSKSSPRLFYNALYAFQDPRKKVEFMNGDQFTEYWTEAGYPAESFQGANTDWQDVMFERGSRMTHTLGVEGGSDKSTFYAAISYNNNDGMVVGDQDTYQRVAAQINATYQVNDWLKVGVNNSVQRVSRDSVSANNFTTSGSAIGGAYFFDPTVPVNYANDADAPIGLGQLEYEANGGYIDRNEEGLLYGESVLMQSNLWNPILMKDNYTNELWNSDINGSAYALFTPIKGLEYTSRLGYRFGTSHSSYYTNAFYHNTQQSRARGGLEAELLHNFYYQWENFVNYTFDVGGNNFAAMAGMQYTNNNNTFVSGSTAELDSDAENYRYLEYSSASAVDEVGGDNIDMRSISYFGRLNWNYEGKYMLQGTFRADAFDASKLSAENRWGYFPAFSAGWDISRENFMQNLSWLNQFKIRGSWGINGNVTVLRGYAYAPSLTLGGADGDIYYSLSDQLITGAVPSDQLPNPDLTWERSKQTDIGFDSRFLNNRLTFSMDYFIKTTDGLLAEGPAPVVSGTSTIMRNTGLIENRGWEFELGWRDEIGDFRYSVIGNLSRVKNEVLESPYGEGRQSGGGAFIAGFVGGGGTYFETGYPIWYLRGRVLDHYDETTGLPVWQTAEQLGTDDGMDYLGSVIPDFSYGLTFTGEYKGIDLRIFALGQEGSELSWAFNRFDLPIMNMPTIVYEDRWTPSNTDARYASPLVYTTGPGIAGYGGSDIFVFDNSFFKIKEVQLGYSLPSDLINRIRISGMRVFVSLENYFTFTDYPGIDPESMADVTGGDALTGGMGIDRVQYPSMKQVTFGVNVSF